MQKPSFEIPPVRFGLYIVLIIFSFILFCISAARLGFTTHLAGDSFYDPVVAELVFTTLVTIGWSIFAVITLLKRLEFGFVTTFLVEIIVLSILWLFWIGGTGEATRLWGDLSACHFSACQLLSALVAFAWLGWITLTVLLIITILFSVANSAFSQHFHGRWDPRISTYSTRA